MGTSLFGNLEAEKRRIDNGLASRILPGGIMTTMVVKVGPEGYVHGWKFVGVPTGEDAARHAAKTVFEARRAASPEDASSFDDHLAELGGDHLAVMAESYDISYDRDRVPLDREMKAAGAPDDWHKMKRTGEDPGQAAASARTKLRKELRGLKPSKLELSSRPLNAKKPQKGTPPDVADAMKHYLASGDIINEYLRTGENDVHDTGYSDKELESISASLDTAIRQGALSKPAVVYRGVMMTPELEKALSKRVFSDPAFMSTSADPKIAAQYANGIMGPNAINDRDGVPAVMKIKLPAGANVMRGDPESRELVLPRNAKFKVIHGSGPVISLQLMAPLAGS